MSITNAREKMAFALAASMDAEQQLLQGMQQFRQRATNPQLQQLLDEHIQQTTGQIEQLRPLERPFGAGQQVACQAARGLVADGQMLVEQCSIPALRDCAIGDSWLKAEHFEIATYRGMLLAARGNGEREMEQALEQVLQQEEQTAQRIEHAMPMIIQQAQQAEAATA